MVALILLVIVIASISSVTRRNAQQQGTPPVYNEVVEPYNANAADMLIPFNENCVVDETGELESVSRTAMGLKPFLRATGVQPFVYLKAYDASEDPALLSEQEREEMANRFYDDRVADENAFLVVFFEDASGDLYVDYTVYVVGRDAESVMDSYACGVFKDIVMSYWYDESLSMDDVIINSFVETAARIA